MKSALIQMSIFFQSTSHDLTLKCSLVGKGNQVWFAQTIWDCGMQGCHTMGVGGVKNSSVTVESIASTMLYVPRLKGV